MRAAKPARFGGAHDASAIAGSKAADSLERVITRPYLWKVRRPWQDRQMLNKRCGSSVATTASRRLAYGFRTFAKTMRDNRNVQHSSCAT
jgi:hypothetical protein